MNIKTIGHIRNIASTVAKEYGLRKVSLFGSRANGNATKDSDFDFLVEFPEGASIFELAGVQVRLEELIGGKVDVIPSPISKDSLVHVGKEVLLYAQ